MRSLIVIPARLASTRLPRKLLLNETGKPLIQHTYEAACKATRPRGVLVAADDAEIATVVWGFGGWVEMTSPECASGTDRVAEVARKLTDVELLVNVQGDEPEISAAAIDLAVQLLEDNPAAVMATLATPIRSKDKLNDPACVKVVCDRTLRRAWSWRRRSRREDRLQRPSPQALRAPTPSGREGARSVLISGRGCPG